MGYFPLLEFLVSLCEKFNEPIYKENSTNGKKQKRVTSRWRGQSHFSRVTASAPVAHHVVTVYSQCVTNTAPTFEKSHSVLLGIYNSSKK